jgi:hypothetical protein
MYQRMDAQPHTRRQVSNNACDGFQDDIQRLYSVMKVKVKQFRYRPGVAQGVPGS